LQAPDIPDIGLCLLGRRERKGENKRKLSRLRKENTPILSFSLSSPGVLTSENDPVAAVVAVITTDVG
jgi:hypothetical protein